MTVFRNYVFYALLLVLSFSVSCTHEGERNDLVLRNAVKDVDGNKYDAVKIGKQVWMKSNLRTTHFRDGSPILNGGTDTFSLELPCYFQSTATLSVSNGLHYNWVSVNDPRALCPEGWHVPTDEEWTEMEQYVGSQQQYVYGYESANIAKALASQEGWKKYPEVGIPGHRPEANNATEFTAVPVSGYYNSYHDGYYGKFAAFWAVSENNADEAYFHCIDNNSPIVHRNRAHKELSISVRCIQD